MDGKHKKMTKPPLIIQTDWFLSKWSEFALSEDKAYSEARKIYNFPKYRVAETGESYRVINSWGENGLLFEDDKRENGWRKFSTVEMLWIHILRELRAFGFSLAKLKTLRTDLFYFNAGKGDFFDTSRLAFCLNLALVKKDVLLVVDVDGNGSLCLKAEYERSQIMLPLPTSYVLIDINKLCAEIIQKPEIARKNEIFLSTNEQELNILHGIAFDGVSEVKITTKNDKMHKVEMKKSYQNPEDAFKKVRELAQDGKRKRISLETQDGKVIAIEEVEKT